MSEDWSEVDARSDPEQGGVGQWSGNGNVGTDATGAGESEIAAGSAESLTEAQANAAEQSAAEEAAVATAVSDISQSSHSPEGAVTSQMSHVTESNAAEPTEPGAEPNDADAASVPQLTPDDPGAFLAELARAMQATVGLERSRVIEDIERRLASHVARIREREAGEADRMRELADGDLSAIDAWAEAEFERIRAEKARRAEAVRADLDGSLDEHRKLINEEIERVEAVIAVHRSEVDAFFARLEKETDPIVLAQAAMRRPRFPSLETIPQGVSETARATEATTPESPSGTDASTTDVREPLVAVMARGEEPAPTEASWQPPTERPADAPPVEAPPAGAPRGEEAVTATTADAGTQGPEGDAATEAGQEESKPNVQTPATAVVSSTPRPRSSVLQSVPALRPMGSWLGRHSNPDTREFKE